jgi:hypothetical protein
MQLLFMGAASRLTTLLRSDSIFDGACVHFWTQELIAEG